MSGWTWQSASPGIYDLSYATRRVASVWWFHEPAHPAVAMTRIVDGLNLPLDECAPSPTPTWSVKSIPCGTGSTESGWGSFMLGDLEVMAVVWDVLPRHLDACHQRILDALDAGRGLPAVDVRPHVQEMAS